MSSVFAIVCSLSLCVPGQVRVVDGDTFFYRGEYHRIAGIDAPEMKGKCENEIVLAHRAKIELTGLISGKTITITGTKRDKYKRKLVDVTSDGQDAGEHIVKAGLARVWTKTWDGRAEPWCG